MPGSAAPGAAERVLEKPEKAAGHRPGRGQRLRAVARPLVDQRRECLRLLLLIRAVHAAAHDELDKLRIDVGCQQAGQPFQTCVPPRWPSIMCAASCSAM